MEDLALLLFISFGSPLFMVLFICKPETRTRLIFLLFGMGVTVLCGRIESAAVTLLKQDRKAFTYNLAPLIEETMKAVPILIYAFLFKPKKRILLECSVLVGIGFAILENACYFCGEMVRPSVADAFIRGFGTGLMHGVCTLAVGYGMTFVRIRRKLFYTGSVALLSAAVIFHSIYNTLVQSRQMIFGVLLPLLAFLPLFFLLDRNCPDGPEKIF